MSAPEPPPGVKWEGGQWVAEDGRIFDGTNWRPPGPAIERPWDASPPKPPRKDVNPWKVIGILAAIAVALIGLTYAMGSKSSPNTPAGPDNGDKYGAFVVCQQWVEEQLRAPSTADFPTTNGSTITNSGKTWTISSYVDAENGFGAMIRTPWTCTATYQGGDTYRGSATLLD